MHLSQLPLTALRAFEIAARHLSFKAAAAELHVTPTAVSHQIQSLENVLQVKLFERVHRGLVLTAAGKACLEPLRRGFDGLTQAVQVLAGFRDVGVLSLSAPPSFTLRLLMPSTHEFLASHPEVDLNVTTRMREPGLALRSVREEALTLQGWADAADVVIVYGGRPQLPVDVTVREVVPLSITLLCSPELMDGDRPLREPADVFRFPWLHDERGSKYGQMSYWEQWLGAAKLPVDRPEGGNRFTHAALAIEAAVRAEGLLISTPALCRTELERGALVAPFDITVMLDASYYLLTRRPEEPRIRAFCDWLCQTLDKRAHVGTSTR